MYPATAITTRVMTTVRAMTSVIIHLQHLCNLGLGGMSYVAITVRSGEGLTHGGLATPYGDRTLVNIGSGNGLLPDGTQPLPEPMLTDHQWSPMTSILGQFHKRYLNYQSLKSVWKLHVLKFNSNCPGADELTVICGKWYASSIIPQTCGNIYSNMLGLSSHQWLNVWL